MGRRKRLLAIDVLLLPDIVFQVEPVIEPAMNGAIVSAGSPPLWMRVVFGRNPKLTLVRLACLVVTSLILFRFVLIPIRVSGLSMYPTYLDGRVNFVNHQAYRWSKPKRGDVIAFRLPEEGNVVLLKRIIGLPGERLWIREGKVYIDGVLLPEPYVHFGGKQTPGTGREIRLRDDEYYVMGDNRGISIIRRIPAHYILGKVVF